MQVPSDHLLGHLHVELDEVRDAEELHLLATQAANRAAMQHGGGAQEKGPRERRILARAAAGCAQPDDHRVGLACGAHRAHRHAVREAAQPDRRAAPLVLHGHLRPFCTRSTRPSRRLRARTEVKLLGRDERLRRRDLARAGRGCGARAQHRVHARAELAIVRQAVPPRLGHAHDHSCSARRARVAVRDDVRDELAQPRVDALAVHRLRRELQRLVVVRRLDEGVPEAVRLHQDGEQLG
mmetsp:Transcript_7252/g.18588  ORF Transcript_7252/g.18588 Transcript_7252/m.18588 type:complete len:239 (-) Transcript_7252:1438-2154(-)